MRFARFVLFALMALVLAGGWGYLYWQSSDSSLVAGHAARSALNNLRQLDSRWNDLIVGARLLPGRSGAAMQPAGHGRALAELEVRALQVPYDGLGVLLSKVKEAFDDKGQLMQKIAAGEPLHELAWIAPTGPRLDALSRMLDRAMNNAVLQSELYRTWLLYYSAFLLTVLAWLFLELRRANASLERRVAERTSELTETLAKLKQSEAMLVQSEKMSSLGQMVAGLAHEVNTPLAYVKASLEAMRSRLGDAGRLAQETDRLLELLAAEQPDEAALAAQFETVKALAKDKRAEGLEAQLKDGLHGIGRIAELVSNLKDFSRLDRGQHAEVDLHEGIDSTLRIAQHQIGKRAVKKAYGQIPRVRCAPSQVNQVILNLLVNAAQATPEASGQIGIRTSQPDAAHVAIDIADNGHGIPPEVLPRIFDPFFTTKDVGKGTGLGLAICYRIVHEHGGRLEVHSKPGNTRFTVVLPVGGADGASR
jgi:two-component system NtrC family sensor kinase